LPEYRLLINTQQAHRRARVAPLLLGLVASVVASLLVLDAAPAPARAAGRPSQDAAPAARAAELRQARSAVVGAASTAGPVRSSLAPDPQPGPACSGDTRPAGPQPPGARTELVPATFGSSYSCVTDTWTYRVRTTATFDRSRLGAWTVLIDTDGSGLFGPLAANCHGGEYLAAAFQAPDGTFAAEVDKTTGDCDTITGRAPASVTVSADEVAVTFSARALVASGPQGDLARASSLEWASSLSTMTEVLSDQPGIDLPAQGTVADALPLLAAAPACGMRAAAVPGNARSSAGSPDALAPTPDDPGYGNQWALSAVDAPRAWSVTTGSAAVVVADIDTGADGTHPDLAGQLVAGVDVTGPVPQPLAAGADSDTDGHGTAVAGAIAAATDNGIGLAGLGWATRVMPVKASTDGDFTVASVVAGIDWVVQHPDTVPPGGRVRVINLSFSGACDSPAVDAAIGRARAAGMLVTAATGNGARYRGTASPAGSDYVSYPAASRGVLAVGAVGRDGFRAPSSQTGPYVALAAPGGDASDGSAANVSVLAPAGGYSTGSGSSLAAAEAAATAALVWAVQPTWTAVQVSNLLTATATDIGAVGVDLEYGAGVLDAGRAVSSAAAPMAGTFIPVTARRVLDTRTGTGAPVAPIGPGEAVPIQVGGLGPIPGTGVAAVVLHVTAVNESQPTYLTLWPTGEARPLASNLNAGRDTLANNLVIVKAGPGGWVSVYNALGTTDVVADVTGWFSDGTTAAGSAFVGVTPTRLLDTRDGTGVPAAGPLGAGGRVALAVAGASGSPVPAGATAAVVNLTAVSPRAPTFLQAYVGPDAPGTAVLNVNVDTTVANLAIVPLDADGTVTIRNALGSTQVVADVVGYFTTTGTMFHPLSPHRSVDTRDGTGGYGPLEGPTEMSVTIAGQDGVPTSARSVVLNVTATDTTGSGFLTVFPGDTPLPLASSLNFRVGATVPNLVTVPLSPTGQFTVFNSGGRTNVVIDVAGWFE
jgi:subtilisin family serine protease